MIPEYEVVPMPEEPHSPQGWWVVTCNGINHHFSSRDKAERFATDPEYRAEVRADYVKLHDR